MLVPTLLGLTLSFLCLWFAQPRLSPPWRWQWQGGAIHISLYLFAQGSLTLLLARPWFAMSLTLALLFLVIQVGNAKFHSLREPFVFQDFEYFTDAIRHPRLYIPFLGWGKFSLIAIAVVLALYSGIYLEPVTNAWLARQELLPAQIFLFALGGCLLFFGRKLQGLSFSPQEDINRYGLLGSMFHYAIAEQTPLKQQQRWPTILPITAQPDLLVIQSESFFDPRSLFSGINPSVLSSFDQCCQEAICYGNLIVPAWGANTVRSEFAFLSGLNEDSLGVHRFNPYRCLHAGHASTFVQKLKAQGYRTVCIHPYPASFYQRNRVYPLLGFDEFIDITAFKTAERFGPYVADAALVDLILLELQKGHTTKQPIFIFVITMENHGPLHLEKALATDYATHFSTHPPSDCDDLAIYLRHLKNADHMLARLRQHLLNHHHPIRLCWYGDHVPIMPSVYSQLGTPKGNTPFLVWDSTRTTHSTPIQASSRPIATLADALLY